VQTPRELEAARSAANGSVTDSIIGRTDTVPEQ
jgi:hypothetical protein